MGDEYMDRYGRIAHAELDRQLGAGSPAGVDAVADAWRSVEDTVGTLAANLRRGLATLGASWSGAGSEEYQRRVGLIATLADGLAKEAHAVRTGLSLMSAQLAEAQRSAEPDPGPATDWAFDGVLGPALGRTVTAAQRSAAQQKMAKLVSQTALAYQLADHRHWPKTLPPPRATRCSLRPTIVLSSVAESGQDAAPTGPATVPADALDCVTAPSARASAAAAVPSRACCDLDRIGALIVGHVQAN